MAMDTNYLCIGTRKCQTAVICNASQYLGKSKRLIEFIYDGNKGRDKFLFDSNEA